MSFRIRLHPAVVDDLAAIGRLIADYAGAEAADRRLSRIHETILTLAETPMKGSIRDDIAPDLRAIPAGRKAVIAFTVDEANREVLVHAISYAGSDWITRSRARKF